MKAYRQLIDINDFKIQAIDEIHALLRDNAKSIWLHVVKEDHSKMAAVKMHYQRATKRVEREISALSTVSEILNQVSLYEAKPQLLREMLYPTFLRHLSREI